MRVYFKNIQHPKKAAKELSKVAARPLSSCQEAVAKSCGYGDWHELEKLCSHNAENAIPVSYDQLSHEVEVISKIASFLEVNFGDVQFSISKSRLLSTKPQTLEHAIETYSRLLQSSFSSNSCRYENGEIGTLKTKGRNGEVVMLREYGQPTHVITHQSANSIVADFEYQSPKRKLTSFLPMRVYVPYGMWMEEDGSRVLFSRDYKPMWRIREDKSPERLFPWLWIKNKKQEWFWSDSNPPWENDETYQSEIRRLESYSICELPKLVDTIPVLLEQSEVKDFEDAVPVLKENYMKAA